MLRWALKAFAGFVLLILLALLCRNPLLRAFLEYRLRDATGLRARLGEVRTSPALAFTTVKDFRILNPEEFGDVPLFIVPDLQLQLDLKAAASGRIRFKEAHLYLAEFNIVRRANGRWNLDDIERVVRERLRKRKKTRLIDVDFGGIDRLYLTLGTLNLVDRQHSERSRAMHLGVTNELVTTIQSEEDFHAWIVSFMVRLAMQEYFKQPGGHKQKALDLLFEATRNKR